MSVIVWLIAAGGAVAGGFLIAFAWAVRAGQFDDTASPPLRMLLDDSDSSARERALRGVPHVESRP
jgi:cbb3-type cytochrome oxidase maturation protein